MLPQHKELVRLIRPENEIVEAFAFPNKINDELRTRIIDGFFNNYRENLKIEMLAVQLNLSAKQVNRTLQQYYNTSFKQKLLDTRVEVAKELLRMNRPTSRLLKRLGTRLPRILTAFSCREQE
jgi:transcriptional regulator GlxA family with amidase domain